MKNRKSVNQKIRQYHSRVIFWSALALIVLIVGIVAGSTLLIPPEVGNIQWNDYKRQRIVYASFRPANLDIYYFPELGSEPRRITDYPGLDYDPVLSPDGRWVVFTSERRGDADLFALDLLNGGPPRLLIESSIMEDQATFSPDGQSLFFVSSSSGNAEIYSIAFVPDRTAPMSAAVNLTGHTGGDFRPAVSPDGRRVAFSTDRNVTLSNPNPIARVRGGDLYVMTTDGTDLRRLTNIEGWSGTPVWSLDGSMIYFYRRQGTPPDNFGFSLWRIGLEGGEPELVTEGRPVLLSPAVAPDGRIAFVGGTPANQRQTGGFAIWSVAPDGSDWQLESDTLVSYGAPAFAAQAGGFVAHGTGPANLSAPQTGVAPLLGPGPLLPAEAPLSRDLPDRMMELFPLRELMAVAHPSGDSVLRTPFPGPRLIVSSLDGGGAREVITLGGGIPANGLAASPDGKWIVYMQGRMFGNPYSESDLWRVRADGTEAENLTPNSAGNDGFPNFAPDGTWLAFRSGRDGNFEIYRMDADGGGLRNLTNHPARDVFPAVSPRGNQIAFLSDRDSGEPRLYELYVMDLNPDGRPAGIRRLTHNHVQEGHPYFSPDGKWVVFTSEMGGLNDEEPLVQSYIFAPQMYGELFVLRLADGLLVRLTHDKWEDGFPTWVMPP